MKTTNTEPNARRQQSAGHPITIPASAFRRRTETWKTLVAGSYHLCWHPQFIDCALNKVPGATSIKEVVNSRRFLSACARVNLCEGPEQRRLALSSALLLQANGQPHQRLLDIFLCSQIPRAMSNLHIAALGISNREEAYQLLRYHYIVNAGKFEPGSQLPDGRFRTFGYSAFHRSFIRAAWNGIKREFRPSRSLNLSTYSLDSCDDASLISIPDEACVRAQPTDVYDVRMCLPAALRHALSDSLAWDVFYGHVYKGTRLDELVLESKVSPSFLSIKVTSKIVQKLRDYFGFSDASIDTERTKISDLRGLLDGILSEGDFLKFVPRPSVARGFLEQERTFDPAERTNGNKKRR